MKSRHAKKYHRIPTSKDKKLKGRVKTIHAHIKSRGKRKQARRDRRKP